MEINSITGEIVRAAMKVHTALGPGLDLLVEDRVIVEAKAVEKQLLLHQSQLLSHLKLTGVRTGLLINFNVRHLRHGIKRMVR